MPFFTFQLLLILLTFASLSVSPSYAGHKPQSVLDSLSMSSHDPKEQQLLVDLKDARSSSGADSAEAFDKLFALAQFYSETNSSTGIAAIAAEVRTSYSKLNPDDQQKFATVLLQAAIKNLNNQRNEAAEVFYAPVILNAGSTTWKNADALAMSLTSVASKLVESKQLLGAERVFAVALAVQPNNETISRNLAQVHAKLKMYDKAKGEYERLVAKPNPRRYPYDLQELAEIYCAIGDTEKLKSLIPAVDLLCSHHPNDASSVNRLADMIGIFIRAQLFQESRTLYQPFIAAMPADDKSSFVVQRIGSAFDKSHFHDACDLYRFWTDHLKKQNGGNSKEWIYGLVTRICYIRSANATNDPVHNEALLQHVDEVRRELQAANPAPGSVEQRLRLLTCYRLIFISFPPKDFSSVQPIFQNVPDDELSMQLFVDGAQFYSIFNIPDAAFQCKQNAVARMCQLLKPQDSYLQPYVQKLALPSSASAADFTYFAQRFHQSIERKSRSTAPPALLLRDELYKEGHSLDANRLTKEIQSRKLGSS